MSYRPNVPPGMVMFFEDFPRRGSQVSGLTIFCNAPGVKEKVYYTDRFDQWVSEEKLLVSFGKRGNTNNYVEHHGVRMDLNRGLLFSTDLFIVRWYATIRTAANSYIRLQAGNTTVAEALWENSNQFHEVVAETYPQGQRMNFDIGNTVRDISLFVEYRRAYGPLLDP